MAREFPAVDVDPDPIFVRSSASVWTAAGVCAGIDLALALVEEDHGVALAQTVARYLVLHLRRPGGQTQFAAPVWVARAKREPIRAVQDAIESEPRGATWTASVCSGSIILAAAGLLNGKLDCGHMSKASVKTKAAATALIARGIAKPAQLKAGTLLLWDRALSVARAKVARR